MNYVQELDIKEFRGVRKLKEPIKFKKINILIGRNNSGKTTILDALSLLPHPYTGLPDDVRNIYSEYRISYLHNIRGRD